jgi:hypothetical protein
MLIQARAQLKGKALSQYKEYLQSKSYFDVQKMSDDVFRVEE